MKLEHNKINPNRHNRISDRPSYDDIIKGRLRRSIEIAAKRNAELLTKLESKLHKTSHGCWLWEGCKNHGYGVLTHDGFNYLVHRLAFKLYHRTIIPDDCIVCHRCDVKNCINPEHLYLGTPKQNSADYQVRGRIEVALCELDPEYQRDFKANDRYRIGVNSDSDVTQ